MTDEYLKGLQDKLDAADREVREANYALTQARQRVDEANEKREQCQKAVIEALQAEADRRRK